jgi:hypothetical protein
MTEASSDEVQSSRQLLELQIEYEELLAQYRKILLYLPQYQQQWRQLFSRRTKKTASASTEEPQSAKNTDDTDNTNNNNNDNNNNNNLNPDAATDGNEGPMSDSEEPKFSFSSSSEARADMTPQEKAVLVQLLWHFRLQQQSVASGVAHKSSSQEQQQQKQSNLEVVPSDVSHLHTLSGDDLIRVAVQCYLYNLPDCIAEQYQLHLMQRVVHWLKTVVCEGQSLLMWQYGTGTKEVREWIISQHFEPTEQERNAARRNELIILRKAYLSFQAEAQKDLNKEMAAFRKLQQKRNRSKKKAVFTTTLNDSIDEEASHNSNDNTTHLDSISLDPLSKQESTVVDKQFANGEEQEEQEESESDIMDFIDNDFHTLCIQRYQRMLAQYKLELERIDTELQSLKENHSSSANDNQTCVVSAAHSKFKKQN